MKRLRLLLIFIMLIILTTGCNKKKTETDTRITPQKTFETDNKQQNEEKEEKKEEKKENETSIPSEENLEDTNKILMGKGDVILPDLSKRSYRSVAYFTSWSAYARNVIVENIDPNLLTHINFAFANLSQDGEIIIGDSWVDVEKPFGDDSWESPADSRGHFGQLRKMKEKYPHIKTLISVGGWTWSSNFSDVAATESGRKKFASSAADFVSKYGFDGLDIDWEFPVEGGNDITHRAEDKHNYTLLLKETREALTVQGQKDSKTYLLTIAGGPNITFTKNTELKEMMKYLDFINVMTYDYHGGWETVTNHNAPLYANPNDTTEFKAFSVESTINAYIAAGVEPSDLNLGLAFYGRGWINVGDKSNNGLFQSGSVSNTTGLGQGTWEGGVFDFCDIKLNYENKNGYVKYYDTIAQVPYVFNGSNFISYDDEESITAKLQFATLKDLGGVMFWEFTGDKDKVLQTVIADYYGLNGRAQKAVNVINGGERAESKPVTNIDDNSLEENGSGQSNSDTWSKDTIYNGGETVTYQGNSYKAKWWTQGDTPNPNDQWGVWEKVN